MKSMIVTLVVAASLAGCSAEPQKPPDVSDSVRNSLRQAGADLKDVSVNQDRDKGVVTLKGHVATDAEKAQAESITKGLAAGQVVANEIEVLPVGIEGAAKASGTELDGAIEKNVAAALVEHHLRDGVTVRVTAGVVTLTGDVNSRATRTSIEKVAAGVPNVHQVVNKLQVKVKNQKATSSSGT